jgi:hypothetical protein
MSTSFYRKGLRGVLRESPSHLEGSFFVFEGNGLIAGRIKASTYQLHSSIESSD